MVEAASAPNFYLSRSADELVLKVGNNPIHEECPGKRVLVIGGGVTGLTVCNFEASS
jgi:hypothetical protein